LCVVEGALFALGGHHGTTNAQVHTIDSKANCHLTEARECRLAFFPEQDGTLVGFK